MIDFHYCVDVEYDRNYDCISAGCDDICRCSTIYDAMVEYVDIPAVVKKLHKHLFSKQSKAEKEFNLYCLDRIYRYLKLYEPEKWEINVCNGYYGEEIDSVTLEDEKAVIAVIEKFKEADNKLHFILNLEYGFILPEIDGKDYEVKKIPYSKIKINRDYIKKIDTTSVELYREEINSSERLNEYKNMIYMVVLEKEGYYRLIDGYHRYKALEGEKKVKAIAIKGE